MATYAQVHNWLSKALSSLPHYNYGWRLITREHQDVPTLVTTCQFLYSRFGSNWISLSNTDYDQLQESLGRNVPVNGARQVIDRHLLLNMWRPWNLIERQNPIRKHPFRLASQGIQLAQGGGRSNLERILAQVVFVDPHWCTPDVCNQYAGFNVRPYSLFKDVLHECSNYIDRTEYRIFMARLTNQSEETITRAIEFINSFRKFPEDQQKSLIKLEHNIFGTAKKPYQNWIDMDLHTFSFFSVGSTFVRNQNILTFAGTTTAASIRNTVIAIGETPTIPSPPMVPSVTAPTRTLNLRTPPESTPSLIPPAPSIVINTGQEAEDFVHELLEENGFEVRNFSRMRGYGFDLWIRGKIKGDVFYVEVKSSTGTLGTIELTSLECQAAQKYGDRFLLVCVENFDATTNQGDLWIVQNPWKQIPSIKMPITTTCHRATRADWTNVAKKL